MVLEMIGFTGESQVLLFYVTGQTGQVLPVRPAVYARSGRRSPRSDRPTLCRFRFQVVLLDIRDSFMFMALDRYYTYVILLFATNESSWR